MSKLDDMDKVFGLGAVFGTGVTIFTFGVTKLIKVIRTERHMKKIMSNLFQEIDESLKHSSEY